MKNVSTFLLLAVCTTLTLFSALGLADNNGKTVDDVEITELEDLAAALKEVKERKLPLLLIFSATHCFYCERLKGNIIEPMLRSGDYDDRVLIRKVEMDEVTTIRDASGNMVSPSELATMYRIRVTPTVLLIGANGEELAPRQLGINNEDYYGHYLDLAIEDAIKKL